MPTPQRTAELTRILALPRRPQEHDPELARALTANLRRAGGEQVLRPIQATALFEAWLRKGLFAPIGVGEGKTLITLLVALVLGARAPVLLLPAKLVEKTHREIRALTRHWKVPNHIRIYSYELLGRANHVDLLRRHPTADLIVADEAHKLRNAKAAVTRRVRRFFDEHPTVPFVGLSGTVTKRSIRDYEHLARWALKGDSPLPHVWGELEDWSDVLDQHDRDRPDPGALVLLSDGDPDLEAVRRGYQRRLVETPGVVASVRNRIGASLLLRGVRYPQSGATQAALRTLRSTWELPDGTPLVDGMAIWRHARELALGFWMRWDPAPPKEWLEPRSTWARACRDVLSRSRSLDSEGAVMQAIDRGDHRELAGILAAWRAVKDSFIPNPVPVWIDDGPLKFAEAWGRDHEGIIWTSHVPFARALEARGLTYYGRHGKSDDGRALDAHTSGSCIASIQSGGEGFNLQRWSEALVTAVVPNGVQSEQLFGRLHRPGQENDVTFDLMLGCAEHVESFWKAHADARFVYATTGDEQKLCYADIDVPHDFRAH